MRGGGGEWAANTSVSAPLSPEPPRRVRTHTTAIEPHSQCPSRSSRLYGNAAVPGGLRCCESDYPRQSLGTTTRATSTTASARWGCARVVAAARIDRVRLPHQTVFAHLRVQLGCSGSAGCARRCVHFSLHRAGASLGHLSGSTVRDYVPWTFIRSQEYDRLQSMSSRVEGHCSSGTASSTSRFCDPCVPIGNLHEHRTEASYVIVMRRTEEN